MYTPTHYNDSGRSDTAKAKSSLTPERSGNMMAEDYSRCNSCSHQKNNKDHERTDSLRPFVLDKRMNYKCKRWRRLRERILRRDGYMCQASLRYGRHKEADTVHHIFPASKYPEYEWEPWNLISLCASEHNAMHIRESDELTDTGKKLLERTAAQQGITP